MKPEELCYLDKNGKKITIDKLNSFYITHNVMHVQVSVPQYYSQSDIEAIKEIDPNFSQTRIERSETEDTEEPGIFTDTKENQLRISLVKVLNKNCVLLGDDMIVDQTAPNRNTRETRINKKLENFISELSLRIKNPLEEPLELSLTKMFENECQGSLIKDTEFAAICYDIRNMLQENGIPVSDKRFLYLVDFPHFQTYNAGQTDGHFYVARKEYGSGPFCHRYTFDFCSDPQEVLYDDRKLLVFLEGEEIKDRDILNEIAKNAVMPISQGFERDQLELDLSDEFEMDEL